MENNLISKNQARKTLKRILCENFDDFKKSSLIVERIYDHQLFKEKYFVTFELGKKMYNISIPLNIESQKDLHPHEYSLEKFMNLPIKGLDNYLHSIIALIKSDRRTYLSFPRNR